MLEPVRLQADLGQESVLGIVRPWKPGCEAAGLVRAGDPHIRHEIRRPAVLNGAGPGRLTPAAFHENARLADGLVILGVSPACGEFQLVVESGGRVRPLRVSGLRRGIERECPGYVDVDTQKTSGEHCSERQRVIFVRYLVEIEQSAYVLEPPKRTDELQLIRDLVLGDPLLGAKRYYALHRYRTGCRILNKSLEVPLASGVGIRIGRRCMAIRNQIFKCNPLRQVVLEVERMAALGVLFWTIDSEVHR